MIQLFIDKKQPNYRSGDKIDGQVRWQELHGSVLEIRLAWYTTGKGGEVGDIVAIHKISPLPNGGSDTFQFIAPHRPESFMGEHVKIHWAVEAIMFPDQVGARIGIVISNSGKVLEPKTAIASGKVEVDT